MTGCEMLQLAIGFFVSLAITSSALASSLWQEQERVYDIKIKQEEDAVGSLLEIEGELPKFKSSTLALAFTLMLARQSPADAVTSSATAAEDFCSIINVTVFATNSHAIRVLGPFLLDTLSLGALNLASHRTNDSSTVIRVSYLQDQGLVDCDAGENESGEELKLSEDFTSLLLSEVSFILCYIVKVKYIAKLVHGAEHALLQRSNRSLGGPAS